MKQIHLPSPAAGQHQPCRQTDAGLSLVSGSTATVGKRSTTPTTIRTTLPSCPLTHLVGMNLTEVGAGKATSTMPASPWLVSPQGVITVCTLAILADGLFGCAVQTALPPGTGYTTSELSLRVVRLAKWGLS
jgi:acyl-coenzyme A thioesterase PaaI-like protein